MGEDVAVLNESTWALSHSRALRLTTALLLTVSALYFGYGVSPLMQSRCGCLHGPEVPCDCPHHAHSKDGPPPPCHIHAKSKAPAHKTLPLSSIRVRCGAIHPDLILVSFLSISPPEEHPPELLPTPVLRAAPTAPPDVFIPPSKHPPKVRS
jgi:hypothetical protein